MKIVSAIRRLVRERVSHPITGWALDRSLSWIRGQDGWEGILSALVHTSLETTSPIKIRANIAECIATYSPYLGADSREVLQHIDEIVQKHSSETN